MVHNTCGRDVCNKMRSKLSASDSLAIVKTPPSFVPLLPDPSFPVFVLDEHPARKTERHKIVIKQITSPF